MSIQVHVGEVTHSAELLELSMITGQLLSWNSDRSEGETLARWKAERGGWLDLEGTPICSPWFESSESGGELIVSAHLLLSGEVRPVDQGARYDYNGVTIDGRPTL